MIYITGHKNPDTDSICSALIAEDYFTKKGLEVKAIAQGTPNKETQYALTFLGILAPEVMTVSDGEDVILVDHNNPMESLDNLDNLNIKWIIDHHAVKVETSYPFYFRLEPIGCTASIFFKMYRESGFEIPKKIASLMLSAICSDSLLTKSPTCTEEDKEILKQLEEISGLKMNEYGLDMLKAGTDLSTFSAKEVINIDAKKMMLKDINAKIAQVNTASIEDTLERVEEYKEEMQKEIDENGFDLFMFAVTDIMNSNSVAVVLGNRKDVVEKAYNVKLENDMALLEGVVSRKKQIVPILTENA